MTETDTVVARASDEPEKLRAAVEALHTMSSLQAENEALRRALIATGRNIGAGLADTVSSDFLTLLPEEARLFAAAREAAEAKAARLEETLEGIAQFQEYEPAGPAARRARAALEA